MLAAEIYGKGKRLTISDVAAVSAVLTREALAFMTLNVCSYLDRCYDELYYNC